MNEVTVSQVKSDIKPFQAFSADHVNENIQQAKVRAKADGIPSTDTSIYNAAILDFSRHLLIVDQFEKNGAVTHASIMGNSQQVADPNTYANGDQYLQAYKALANQYGAPVGQASFQTMNGLNYDDLF